MAIDAFLDFTTKGTGTSSPEIKGESQDKQFADTFHVKTFTFAVNQKGTAGTGSGLGAGKAEFDDFEFVIDTQKGSSLLLQHCAKGTHFEKVLLHVRKAGGEHVEYLRYLFTTCMVSSFSTSGDEESTDTVKFNYRRVYTQYIPQSDKGDLDFKGKSYGGWDLDANDAYAAGLNDGKFSAQGAGGDKSS